MFKEKADIQGFRCLSPVFLRPLSDLGVGTRDCGGYLLCNAFLRFFCFPYLFLSFEGAFSPPCFW